MTENHPITPPQWQIDAWQARIETMGADVPLILLEVVQWGADQELEACCEWFVRDWTDVETADKLRAARRPSLKEEALLKLKELQALLQFENVDSSCIRQALEQLPDIKWSLPR